MRVKPTTSSPGIRGPAIAAAWTAVCTLFSPPAVALDEYRFDPVHTQIMFSTSHLGFSNPVGRFRKFDGVLRFDPQDMQASNVSITIFSDSVEMGDPRWNKALRGKKYFDSDAHPEIRFTSTAIDQMDAHSATVTGNLTLLGVTAPVTLQMRLNRVGIHPLTGRQTAGFSGIASLKRSDFGMTEALNMVGDEVDIMLEVEGVLDREQLRPF